MSENIILSIAGAAAGTVNGLFGAGGGLVLVPMLGKKVGLREDQRFPASIAIIAPVCVTSLLISGRWELSFMELLPYLLGSVAGGFLAGILGKKIPTTWLHRFLGGIILWGGIRFIW